MKCFSTFRSWPVRVPRQKWALQGAFESPQIIIVKMFQYISESESMIIESLENQLSGLSSGHNGVQPAPH